MRCKATWVSLFVLVALLSTTVAASAQNLIYSGWIAEESPAKLDEEWVMSQWNTENPDARVQWTGWPFSQALNQMLIRFRAGDPMDVAHINSDWLPVFIGADALVDLETLIDPALLEEMFDPAALAAGRRDGVQYALPRTMASIAMVYNPSLLGQAGIDQAPTTIDEFEDALAALRKMDPDIVPYALATTPDTLGKDVQMWFWTFGGRVFDDAGNVVINSPENLRALTWLTERVEVGDIAFGLSRFDARTLAAAGRVGFYDDAVVAKSFLLSQSGAQSQEDLLEMAHPMARPVVTPGDPPSHLLWGNMFVVFKGPRAEKASEFALFAAGTDAALKRLEIEGIPVVTQDGMEHPDVQADLWISTWVPDLTWSAKPAETESFAEKAALDSVIAEEVQAALTGIKTPEQALRDAARRLEDTLR